MGKAGARFSEAVGAVADDLVERMGPLGPVSWRKMFGGAGVFVDGKMFALVDPEAQVHLKVGATNRERFDAAGSTRQAASCCASGTRLGQVADWSGASVSRSEV